MGIYFPKTLLAVVVVVPWTRLVAALLGCIALFVIVCALFGSITHEHLVGVNLFREAKGIRWHEIPVEFNQDVSVKSNRGSETVNDHAIATQFDSYGKQDVTDGTIGTEFNSTFPSDFVENYTGIGSVTFVDKLAHSNQTLATAPLPMSASLHHIKKNNSRSCDLYHGKWIHDPARPLYTNNTCPILTQSQNCQGNGRPDKDYENWRWKPHECELPRFDAVKFLELMRGRTLAFVGDSIARNQMESLICMLWQVEAPTNRGNRRIHRWHFRSTSTTVVRIWSSWLVHATPDVGSGNTPAKVHLDVADEAFMDPLPEFDAVVLSSGHWFAKRSAYLINGTVVGGQIWKPKKPDKLRINNVKAFGLSTETALNAVLANPSYLGVTILRSYTPDHYGSRAWNKGGSCGEKTRPARQPARNGFTSAMHEMQVAGFKRAVLNARGGMKVKMMDITEAFGYRHDGHPGPYRAPDRAKFSPNGRPAPEDCLHWCMPGPVDVWNEMLLEILVREFEGT